MKTSEKQAAYCCESNLRAATAQGQCRRLVQRCGSCGKDFQISSATRDPYEDVPGFNGNEASPSRTDRLLATRFPVLLPTIIFHNYPAKILAQQRNFVRAEGKVHAFRPAAVTNSGIRASIQNRHEITK